MPTSRAAEPYAGVRLKGPDQSHDNTHSQGSPLLPVPSDDGKTTHGAVTKGKLRSSFRNTTVIRVHDPGRAVNFAHCSFESLDENSAHPQYTYRNLMSEETAEVTRRERWMKLDSSARGVPEMNSEDSETERSAESSKSSGEESGVRIPHAGEADDNDHTEARPASPNRAEEVEPRAKSSGCGSIPGEKKEDGGQQYSRCPGYHQSRSRSEDFFNTSGPRSKNGGEAMSA